MQNFQCQKVVEAFKIDVIEINRDESVTLRNFSEQIELVKDREWYLRFEPKMNGYFVRGDNGYEFYEPQESFENGYVQI